MKSLILIFQFLTKLPINISIDSTREDFSKGIIYFPIVGLVIGLLLSIVYYLTDMVFSKLVVSVLVVAFEMFITGGLHLDGLADSFDGLYSYRKKDRILEIMKDSRIGANGVLILVISIIFKIVLINDIDSEFVYYALVLMVVISRFTVVLLSRFSVYARKEGMGGFFIGETSNAQFIIAFILTLLPITILSILNILSISLLIKIMVSFILVLISTFLFRNHVYKIIDGITGDILGAWVELSEILFLFLFIIMIKI